MRALLTLCLAGTAAASLAACASDSGYGYNGYANSCDRARSNNQVAGAVVGGAVGALGGSAIAGRHSRTEGAVLGGVAGAVVGSEVAKSNDPCRNTSAYYDNRDNRQVYYDERGRAFYYDSAGQRYYR